MGSDRRFRGNAMNSPLFDMSQYQSATTRSYSPDWRDAAESDPAWDVSDLEPNLEARTDEPDGNAPTGWQTESEFTITLESGQTVQGNFIPCLEGEHRMHQFDFTGPVSTTGFKSRFVLAAEAEEYPHPCDYAQAYIQDLVARFEAAQQQQAKSKKRARLVAEVETPQERTADNGNFRLEPTMAENETTDSSRVKVEVVEELSPEEEAERQQLELRVDRALYSAGCALRELRDRRLYRSTHKSWQEYCQERFGYGRDSADLRILAAEVVENVEDKVPTNRRQILPTKLEQIRPLTKLEPGEQRQVWEEAVVAAGGRVPSGRVVKSIVERLKERDTTPPPIPFQPGDVMLIRGLGNPELRKYDGQWAIALAINEYTVTVGLNGLNIPVKPQFLEPVEPEYWVEIKAVNERISRLQLECDLDAADDAVLEVLRRRTCFTSRQMLLLERMEEDYALAN